MLQGARVAECSGAREDAPSEVSHTCSDAFAPAIEVPTSRPTSRGGAPASTRSSDLRAPVVAAPSALASASTAICRSFASAGYKVPGASWNGAITTAAR